MPIKLTAVEDAFYAVLRTDSAGAAVRDALGDGANSVLWAEDLSRESLPKKPFVALAILPVAGAWQDVRTHVFEWYGYDDIPKRYERINTVLQLVEAAYTPESITFGETRMIGPISQKFTDAPLSLRARRIRFSFTTRR